MNVTATLDRARQQEAWSGSSSHGTPPGMADRPLVSSPAMSITGFDMMARAWMSECGQETHRAPVPFLSGKLFVDVASQIRAVDEDGEPARQLIAAMLLPGNVEDIVRMMRFCDEHGILVTSPNAAAEVGPGPVVRIHADATGRQRPMLRVVGSD